MRGAEWTAKWWFADYRHHPRGGFQPQRWALYRPQSRAQVEHRDPLEILDELMAVEREIMEELEELRSAVMEVTD